MTLVSVVIPIFNGASTIQRTLESVGQQSHQDLEVFVVNDGSTDQSAEIIERYCAHDRRFRLITKVNGGVASARNLGISKAQADYVAVIDADDLWHSQFIEKTLRKLQEGGERMGFAYAPHRIIDEDDRIIGSAHVFGSEGQVLCQHLTINPVGNGSGILVRRKAP